MHPSDTWALVGATASLFISSAGAGLLSYPFAAQQQGVAVTVATTACFAVLNGYTDLVLAATAYRLRHSLVAFTYEELCLRVLGRAGYAGVVASVVISCIGTAIAFFIVIGDVLAPVISAACTHGGADPSSGACAVVSHRAFPVCAFALLVALPFAACDRIHSLGGSSLLAAVSVLAVVALAAARGAAALATGTTQCIDASGAPMHAPIPSPGSEGLWLGSGWRVLLGLPLVVFALGNHVQAVPLFLELGRGGREHCSSGGGWRTDAANPQLRFPGVVAVVMALCAGLYSTMGAMGVLACGAATQGDFLLNFPAGDTFADVARAFMAIHIALAIPVVVVPCRRALVMLAMYVRDATASQATTSTTALRGSGSTGVSKHAEDIETTAHVPLLPRSHGLPFATDSRPHCSDPDPHATLLLAYATHAESSVQRCGMSCGRSEAALTFCIVLGSAAIAVAFPQVQVVFGLLGATVSTAQIYLVPALLLWARATELDSRSGASADRSLGLNADARVWNGATVDDSRVDSEHATQAGASADYSASALLTSSWIIPHSPTRLRIIAVCLFAVAFLVGVLCRYGH